MRAMHDFPKIFSVAHWMLHNSFHKVVIIGQDPYHGQGQAHGLCFSVQKGVQIPPSLRNMIQELKVRANFTSLPVILVFLQAFSFFLQSDKIDERLFLHIFCTGIAILNRYTFPHKDDSVNNVKTPTHGNLECWAKQGVLLLNTCMTVRSGMANSHQNKGWETFTDAVVKHLAARKDIVYLLWGNPAQAKYVLPSVFLFIFLIELIFVVCYLIVHRSGVEKPFP
jgi:uracil-DNA glycosylase